MLRIIWLLGNFTGSIARLMRPHNSPGRNSLDPGRSSLQAAAAAADILCCNDRNCYCNYSLLRSPRPSSDRRTADYVGNCSHSRSYCSHSRKYSFRGPWSLKIRNDPANTNSHKSHRHLMYNRDDAAGLTMKEEADRRAWPQNNDRGCCCRAQCCTPILHDERKVA